MKFYTMDTDDDFSMKCIFRRYGQVFNDEMTVNLLPCSFRYGTQCTGNITIQDYTP